jgi:tetratricopeptide (TPR) repeat protein
MLQRLGRYEDALGNCERALAISAHEPQTLFSRGNALMHLKRYDEAIDAFDRALAVKPRFPAALNQRGVCLDRLGRHDEAVASFTSALVFNFKDVEARFNRGLALESLHRYEKALTSYDGALAINPRFVNALNNRGNVLVKLGRYDKALASYQRALEIDPNCAQASHNRALLLEKLISLSKASVNRDGVPPFDAGHRHASAALAPHGAKEAANSNGKNRDHPTDTKTTTRPSGQSWSPRLGLHSRYVFYLLLLIFPLVLALNQLHIVHVDFTVIARSITAQTWLAAALCASGLILAIGNRANMTPARNRLLSSNAKHVLGLFLTFVGILIFASQFGAYPRQPH